MGEWRSWKGWLALISLLLTALLWINGLLTSLERPSVGNSLQRRQLELAVLAEPQLRSPLGAMLLGPDPAEALRQELGRQAGTAQQALPPQQRYTWALLEHLAGHDGVARQVLASLPDLNSPDPNSSDSKSPDAIGIAAQPTALQTQLLCQLKGGLAGPCGNATLQRQALARLLAITLAPVGLMLVGLALLLRQLWLAWRRRLPALAPLEGPPLSLVDVTLLVAGGFVVLGELLTPLVVVPLLGQVLAPLSANPPLQQGLSVLLLYLALMLGPLLILAALLRRRGPMPSQGWLQWRWRPVALSLRRALALLLMVLPLVALVGWLLETLWGDPGGSNPLLDLVLTSPSPLALALFGLTAMVLAPLFEETLFRGVLLPVLARQWGGGWGVVLSAAFFALAHLSLGEFAPLFVLGLGLGWLRLSGGRLGASVLMHGLWNGLTFANLLLLAG